MATPKKEKITGRGVLMVGLFLAITFLSVYGAVEVQSQGDLPPSPPNPPEPPAPDAQAPGDQSGGQDSSTTEGQAGKPLDQKVLREGEANGSNPGGSGEQQQDTTAGGATDGEATTPPADKKLDVDPTTIPPANPGLKEALEDHPVVETVQDGQGLVSVTRNALEGMVRDGTLKPEMLDGITDPYLKAVFQAALNGDHGALTTALEGLYQQGGHYVPGAALESTILHPGDQLVIDENGIHILRTGSGEILPIANADGLVARPEGTPMSPPVHPVKVEVPAPVATAPAEPAPVPEGDGGHGDPAPAKTDGVVDAMAASETHTQKLRHSQTYPRSGAVGEMLRGYRL